MKKTVSFLCAVLILLNFSACSAKKQDPEAYCGAYLVTEIISDAGIDLIAEYKKVGVRDFLIYELKEDGTLLITSFGEETDGTWETGEEENSLILNFNDGTYDAVYNEKTITWYQEGYNYTMEWVDEEEKEYLIEKSKIS